MSLADEFRENNKHIYDYAAQKRTIGNNEDANLIFYLLACITDRCDKIDEQQRLLKKTWKGKTDVN
jgi:hypothetical protein